MDFKGIELLRLGADREHQGARSGASDPQAPPSGWRSVTLGHVVTLASVTVLGIALPVSALKLEPVLRDLVEQQRRTNVLLAAVSRQAPGIELALAQNGRDAVSCTR